jgi:hypothetical protein
VLVFAVGGCSGGRGAITTVDALVDSTAKAYCSWQFKCCAVPEILSMTTRYVTEDECVPYLKLELGDLLASTSLAVDGRRQALDPAAAAACVDQLSAQACNGAAQLGALLPSTPACAHVFTGRVAAGAACQAIADCAAGSHCLFPQLGSTSPPDPITGLFGDLTTVSGVCTPFQPPGGICNTSDDCDAAAGLHCRSSDYRCGPFAQAGEACAVSLVGPGVPGTGGNDCDSAAGLYCDIGNALIMGPGGPSAQGICRPSPRDGEPCVPPQPFQTVSSLCDPDPTLRLSCVGSGFNGNGICETAAKVGDACGGSGLPPCDSGLVCSVSISGAIGACAAAPGQGQPCTILGECLDPAVCNPATKVCDLPGVLRAGDVCGANTDCASLLCGPSSASASDLVCLTGQAPVSCTGVNSGAGFVPSPQGQGGIGGGVVDAGVPIPRPGTSGAGGAAGASSGGLGGGPGGVGGGGPIPCDQDTGTTPDTISDFEDGTGAVLSSEGRGGGSWFAFVDGGAGCMHTLPESGPIMAVAIPGGRCGSSFGLEVVGGDCSALGLGADFIPPNDGVPVPYDASAFAGVVFWARSDEAGAMPLLRVDLPDADTDARGGCVPEGSIPCDDHFGIVVPLGFTWQRFLVRFNALSQKGTGVPVPGGFDPSRVFGIRFTFPDGPPVGLPPNFDFWIDDVLLVH